MGRKFERAFSALRLRPQKRFGRRTVRSSGLSAVCRLQSALGLRARRALSSAGAKGAFPVSVSLGVYRVGKGNEWIFKGEAELIASPIATDQPLFREFGQSRAEGRGFHSTELAQVLHGGGLLELCEDLAHSLNG